MNKRICEFIDYLGIAVSDFERRCGLSNGSVAKMGDNTRMSTIDKISNSYPMLNVVWLRTGEGPMLRGGTETPSPSRSLSSGAPYYDVDFMGGFDLMVNDQTQTPAFLIDFAPMNMPGVFWCNVTGHSMEPYINHGDIIAMREVRDWQTFIEFGEVYAIVTANELRTIKRVRRGSDGETLRLVPNNPEYDEQEIPKSSVVRVFQVLSCIKRF